jgi:hypothetical protein
MTLSYVFESFAKRTLTYRDVQMGAPLETHPQCLVDIRCKLGTVAASGGFNQKGKFAHTLPG